MSIPDFPFFIQHSIAVSAGTLPVPGGGHECYFELAHITLGFAARYPGLKILSRQMKQNLLQVCGVPTEKIIHNKHENLSILLGRQRPRFFRNRPVQTGLGPHT
jgi:hypothetical protein